VDTNIFVGRVLNCEFGFLIGVFWGVGREGESGMREDIGSTERRAGGGLEGGERGLE
jgi:hypothetical protein